MPALRPRVEISNDRRPHLMVLHALPEARVEHFELDLPRTRVTREAVIVASAVLSGKRHEESKCAENSARYSIGYFTPSDENGRPLPANAQ
jgi:hypothetical protein